MFFFFLKGKNLYSYSSKDTKLEHTHIQEHRKRIQVENNPKAFVNLSPSKLDNASLSDNPRNWEHP